LKTLAELADHELMNEFKIRRDRWHAAYSSVIQDYASDQEIALAEAAMAEVEAEVQRRDIYLPDL